MKKILFAALFFLHATSYCMDTNKTTIAKVEHPLASIDDEFEMAPINLSQQCPLSHRFFIYLRDIQCKTRQCPYIIASLITQNQKYMQQKYVDAHRLNNQLFTSYKDFINKKYKLELIEPCVSPIDKKEIVKVEYFVTFKDPAKFVYLTSLSQLCLNTLPRGIHGIFACQDPCYGNKLPTQSRLRCKKLHIMDLCLDDLEDMCSEQDLSHKQFCKLIHIFFRYCKDKPDSLKKIKQLIIQRAKIAFIDPTKCTNLLEALLSAQNLSDPKQLINICLSTLYPFEKKHTFESGFYDTSSDHSSIDEEEEENEQENSINFLVLH